MHMKKHRELYSFESKEERGEKQLKRGNWRMMTRRLNDTSKTVQKRKKEKRKKTRGKYNAKTPCRLGGFGEGAKLEATSSASSTSKASSKCWLSI